MKSNYTKYDKELGKDTLKEGIRTVLLEEIKSSKGYFSILDKVLDSGVDINIEDGLFIREASKLGNIELMYDLMDKGCNIEIESLHYGVPLTGAVSKGHYDAVKLLLESGADANYCQGSLLLLASEKGFLEIAKLLIENNCQLEPSYGIQTGALALASGNGHIEIEYLMNFEFKRANSENEAIQSISKWLEKSDQYILKKQLLSEDRAPYEKDLNKVFNDMGL